MGFNVYARTAALCFMATATVACSSGGIASQIASGIVDETPEADTIRPTGQTIAESIESGQIALADDQTSTGIQINEDDNSVRVVAPPKFQVRNNYVGGLDVSVEGDIIALTGADTQSDLNSWGKSGRGYSLALWNAGKGGREGLFRDEEGQKFHKIIGYRHQDTRADMLTLGHSVIGVETPDSAMDNMPREVQYDGYFFANALPGATPGESDAVNTVGGLRIDADFETNTLVGRSTSFEVKGPTDLGAIATDDRLRFTGNISGTSYTGNISSSQAQLNGAAINGQFYGAGAQETAGIIRGQNAAGSAQGFFSASDNTQ